MKLMDTESIEKRFGLAVVRCDRALTPTGEPHIELTNTAETESAVEDAARAAFDGYASGRNGVLYWRVKPEIRGPEDTGVTGMWSFYMRLLISDKMPRVTYV
jgi:hypothetical protein